MSSLKRNEKITCENCGTQTKRFFLTAYEEVVNWDTSCFSVSLFLNKFPDLNLFPSLVLSNEHWILNALLVDNSQVLLKNEHFPKTGNFSSASNKLQSTLWQFSPQLSTHYSLSLLLGIQTMLLWPVGTHVVVSWSCKVEVGRVNIYIWKRLLSKGKCNFFQ